MDIVWLFLIIDNKSIVNKLIEFNYIKLISIFKDILIIVIYFRKIFWSIIIIFYMVYDFCLKVRFLCKIN